MGKNYCLDDKSCLQDNVFFGTIGAVRISGPHEPGESRSLAGLFLPHSILGNGISASREVERA